MARRVGEHRVWKAREIEKLKWLPEIDGKPQYAPNGKPRRNRYRDGEAVGLILNVHPNGLKTWTVRYRAGSGEDAGAETEAKIGDFPGILPEKARREADRIRAEAQNGAGIVAENREAKAETLRRRRDTMNALCDAYLADMEAKIAAPVRPGKKSKAIRQSTLDKNRQTIECHVRPRLGAQAVSKLRRADIKRHADEIAIPGKDANGRLVGGPSASATFVAMVKLLLDRAVDDEIIDSNPASRITIEASDSRDRVASQAEIRAIWAETERLKSAAHPKEFNPKAWMTSAAIQLCILTMKRRTEVAGINDAEVFFDDGDNGAYWVIPPERSKSGREDVVPLTTEAVRLLREAFGRSQCQGNIKYAFTGKGRKSPMSSGAASKAFSRIADSIGAPDLTLHDMRRTGSTVAPDLGIDEQLISRLLNHAVVGVAATTTKVYNRNTYLPQKRLALEAWERWLRGVREDNVDVAAIAADYRRKFFAQMEVEVANDAAPQPAAVAAE